MDRVLELCEGLPTIDFQVGESLLVQGAPNQHLFVLDKGKVQVIKDSRVIAEVEQPGAVFGELAVILNKTHNATVRAVEPSRCYYITDPQKFFWEQSEFLFELLKILANRLDQMGQTVASKG